MQMLQDATNSSVQVLTAELLDAIPSVMWFIRRELRLQCTAGLTVPQFRVMRIIERGQCGTLSEVAVDLGETLPTTSRLVSGLVAQGMVRRDERAEDRRCRRLALTEAGVAAVGSAMAGVRQALGRELGNMGAEDCARAMAALQALREVFTAARMAAPPIAGEEE